MYVSINSQFVSF